jgi:aldose 1-epimerase
VQLCLRRLRKYCADRMAIDKARIELPQLGRSVDLYTLRRKGGMEAKILTLGGVVTTLTAPDRDGRMGDVVLGFDAPADYLANRPFFGALIGRYGNRIARGDLPLDGAHHVLATNDGPNHLHGGPGGFHTVVWDVGDVIDGDEPALALRYTSRDGEEGYPGTLVVDVCYTLTAEGGARVEYIATTDRPTVVNLTQHSYVNLAGHDAGSIGDHQLRLAASRFVVVDETAIPTGELRDVRGTPFDFLTPAAIGARIGADDQQLRFGRGYDHCYVVDDWDGSLRDIAEVVDPRSGRRMLMRTTQPGVQFYSGNFLDGIAGKQGASYGERSGFCLEAGHFPDSPHRPEFPTTLLMPGELYRQTTEYVFTT